MKEVFLENGNTISPRQSVLVLHFIRSKSKPYYRVENEGLGLSVYADTIEDLSIIVHEQIAILWEEFVLCEDEKMTPQAQQLKVQLLKTFE